jgi:hypothetical protein
MSICSTAQPKALLIGRKGAAAMIGQSLSKIDELVADGALEAVKANKRLLILVASIERYVAELPRATLKPYVRKPRDIEPAPLDAA